MRIDRRQHTSAGPASRQVYRRCADAIIATDLAPGQRISENELAERLAVSRTPIREAVDPPARRALRPDRSPSWAPSDADQRRRRRGCPVQSAIARMAGRAADRPRPREDGDIAALDGLVQSARVSEHGDHVRRVLD